MVSLLHPAVGSKVDAQPHDNTHQVGWLARVGSLGEEKKMGAANRTSLLMD